MPFTREDLEAITALGKVVDQLMALDPLEMYESCQNLILHLAKTPPGHVAEAWRELTEIVDTLQKIALKNHHARNKPCHAN